METFGIVFLIVTIVVCLIKAGGKYPVGCLIVFMIFGIFFIKACNEMEEEERQRVEYSKMRRESLRKEMEGTMYMRTEEYQKEQWRKTRLHESDDKKK